MRVGVQFKNLCVEVRVVGFDPRLLDHVLGASSHTVAPPLAKVPVPSVDLHGGPLPPPPVLPRYVHFEDIDLLRYDVTHDLQVFVLLWMSIEV